MAHLAGFGEEKIIRIFMAGPGAFLIVMCGLRREARRRVVCSEMATDLSGNRKERRFRPQSMLMACGKDKGL